MADNVNPVSSILVLGEPVLGARISNWIAETSQHGERVALAVRGDVGPSPLPHLHSGVEFVGALSRPESEALAAARARSGSFLITCYWPWILPESAYTSYAGATLNFHPALLPRDRGWYPHVHQIRHRLPAGVSLHQLDADADTGRIWAQREVRLPFPVTAGIARDALREEIFDLFTECWWDIAAGGIEPWDQRGPSSYHAKGDVESLDHVDREAVMTFEDAVRIIACRNSGPRSFLWVDGDDGPTFIHITFTHDGRLSNT